MTTQKDNNKGDADVLRKTIIEYCMSKIEKGGYRTDVEKYEDIIEEIMADYFTERGLGSCNEFLNQLDMARELRGRHPHKSMLD